MNSETFYSRGKFLISGEYLVLNGAVSLVLPLKFGQSLRVEEDSSIEDFQIHWRTMINNKLWFDAIFDLEALEIIETNNLKVAGTLEKILKAAHKLNPTVLKHQKHLALESSINFNIEWGLGSSSSLTSNIAHWFGIDPFDLHFATSSGSAFDVAAARADGPFFYSLHQQKPDIVPAVFNPDFKSQIFFVYLGKKQQSAQSIQNLSKRLFHRESEIIRISEISKELTATNDLEEFNFFIDEHETLMSKVLGMPTVRQSHFKDFDGGVKSLGAWGGDFVMMTSKDGRRSLEHYLEKKGLHTVFSFDEIVL